MTVELPEGCPACGALPCDWAPGTPSQTVSQDRAVEAWYLIPLLRAWDPQADDRVVPLLLAEAGRRAASSYDIEDAENVIAFLLSRLAAFKKSELGHG